MSSSRRTTGSLFVWFGILIEGRESLLMLSYFASNRVSCSESQSHTLCLNWQPTHGCSVGEAADFEMQQFLAGIAKRSFSSRWIRTRRPRALQLLVVSSLYSPRSRHDYSKVEQLSRS